MTVQDTSIKTYKEIVNEGLLGRMEEIVLALIKQNPFLCDREYSEISKLKINQITGRRHGLLEQGCVFDAGTKIDPVTNRTVHIWAVPEEISFKKKEKNKVEVEGQ